MIIKRIILFAFLISFLCCGQHKENDANIKNEQMNNKLQGFPIPDEKTFHNRLEYVFGVEIDKYEESQQIFKGILPNKSSNDIKILIPKFGFISESESQPMVHLNEFYISWDDPEEDINSLLFLNKYIFYEENSAFNYLKLNKSGYLYYLVIDFGYTKDPKIVDFILNEVGVDFDEDESNEFATRVFIGPKGMFGKRQIRKDLIRKYFEKYPTSQFMYFNLAEKILSSNNEGLVKYEGDKYENAALLLEIQLEYAEKQLGTSIHGGVDYVLKKYPDFLTALKKNKGYDYKLLSNYKLYNALEDEIIGYGVVQDSDGYSNIREASEMKSSIIGKVNTGEGVFILENINDWFKIETKEGDIGYIHGSRIKLE